MKKLASALEAAGKPGLTRTEIHRLQTYASIAKIYKDFLVDYLNYREIEARLCTMEEKLFRSYIECGAFLCSGLHQSAILLIRAERK